MISKEICDLNKCPLIPPNCGMFFLAPPDCPDKSEDVRNKIFFSPDEYHAESIKWWSHDESFPVGVSAARPSLRKVIAAVACLAWRDEAEKIQLRFKAMKTLPNAYHEAIKMCDLWKAWALADPEEDDDEDDIDVPVVFKEPA